MLLFILEYPKTLKQTDAVRLSVLSCSWQQIRTNANREEWCSSDKDTSQIACAIIPLSMNTRASHIMKYSLPDVANLFSTFFRFQVWFREDNESPTYDGLTYHLCNDAKWYSFSRNDAALICSSVGFEQCLQLRLSSDTGQQSWVEASDQLRDPRIKNQST